MSFSFKRIKFEHNLGDKDQKIRYGFGIGFVFISLFIANVFLLLSGILLIGSAYLSWCPAYSGMAKNTCSDSTASNK